MLQLFLVVISHSTSETEQHYCSYFIEEQTQAGLEAWQFLIATFRMKECYFKGSVFQQVSQ